MKTFEVGERTLCFYKMLIYDCVVVDVNRAPLYTVRTEKGSGIRLDFWESDMFKYDVNGLNELINFMKYRVISINREIDIVSSLLNEIEKVDLLIKSAEEK